MSPDPAQDPGRPDDPAIRRWDVPTEPGLRPPWWPPDDDPFVTMGLMDDLI